MAFYCIWTTEQFVQYDHLCTKATIVKTINVIYWKTVALKIRGTQYAKITKLPLFTMSEKLILFAICLNSLVLYTFFILQS